MTKRPFKDHDWPTLVPLPNNMMEQWQEAQLNLLMDIRDEIKEIKEVLQEERHERIHRNG